MTALVLYPALVVAFLTAVCGVVAATRRAAKRDAAAAATRNPPVPTPEPVAASRDLHRLVDDLHRLESEYILIERSDRPAKAARLRAINLAYDDTLRECCLALGLPEPAERPLSGLLRLQTEAELAQHGLVW